MRNFISYTVLLLICISPVFGQLTKVEEARNALVAGEFGQAEKYIEEAVNDESLANEYHTWYWRGTVYKEIYKATEKGKQYNSSNREKAVQSYLKALNEFENVNQDTVNRIYKSLNYIASTLYNDAVVQLDTVNYENAINNYKQYTSLMKAIEPENDLTAQNIQFKMKLATIFVSLYENNAGKERGEEYFERAKKEYTEILEMKKSHMSANYNLGILFYNKAVHIIQSMEYDIDLETLSEKEEECVELFLQSLPYMISAYELDPTRRETLISLKGIYYSLNDMEKYEKYKEELDALGD